MIRAVDVLACDAAKQKAAHGEALTAEEQTLVDRLGHLGEPKKCGCGCGEPLEPRVDGRRPEIKGVKVNPDCYFAAFGDEIDNFPIGGHRGIHRRGAI